MVCWTDVANTNCGAHDLTFLAASMSKLVELKEWAVDVLILVEIHVEILVEILVDNHVEVHVEILVEIHVEILVEILVEIHEVWRV